VKEENVVKEVSVMKEADPVKVENVVVMESEEAVVAEPLVVTDDHLAQTVKMSPLLKARTVLMVRRKETSVEAVVDSVDQEEEVIVEIV